MVKNKRVTVSLNALLVLFFVFDLMVDLAEGKVGIEFFLELIAFGMAATLLIYDTNVFYRMKGQYQEEQLRSSRLSGALSEYIDHQFESWKLTKSEREIARMLIHGYAFQEIAQARHTKEKTVRQQATTLYAKSGTGNRAEFVALFLEDLLGAAHLDA